MLMKLYFINFTLTARCYCDRNPTC